MKYLLLSIKHLAIGIIWIISIILFSFLLIVRFLWDFYFDTKSFKEMFDYKEFCQVVLNSLKPNQP